MQKVKPLKKFGQNYLWDQNIINKIVDEIAPENDDNLIEIGPGLGSLTNKLLERTNTITAVEIDTRVIEILSGKYPGLDLIREDFLQTDLQELYSKKNKLLRITGNIPFNITSSVLFKIIENNNIIKDAVLMLQHEVAQRIAATRGTKEYGILAVLLGYFAEIKLCFKVSPNVFYPKPKVYSAVVHIYIKEIKMDTEEKELFINIVKAAFGHRRKTLKNSLSNSIFKFINFSNSDIDLSLRAEQLKINDFLKLTKFVKNKF
ncbi:MAG TPA: ribosomal RNA small subunit methyltransferase A [Ignavibacteria bacterium]|nr:ribosomal RNA small subunit methyltransferase A [Ignavibacteria bacterium]